MGDTTKKEDKGPLEYDDLFTKENLPRLIDEAEARMRLAIINTHLDNKNKIDFDDVLKIYDYDKDPKNNSYSMVQIVEDMLVFENEKRDPNNHIFITREQEKEIYFKKSNYEILNKEIDSLKQIIENNPRFNKHPLPPIIVVDSNEIAAGYNSENGTILITRGLIENCPPHIIRAIVAHEYGHHIDNVVNGFNGHAFAEKLNSSTLTEAQRQALIELRKGRECIADRIGIELVGKQDMLDAFEYLKKTQGNNDKVPSITHPYTVDRENAAAHGLFGKLPIEAVLALSRFNENNFTDGVTSTCEVQMQYPPNGVNVNSITSPLNTPQTQTQTQTQISK